MNSMPLSLTGSVATDGMIAVCVYALLLLYCLFGTLHLVDYARRHRGVVAVTGPSLLAIAGLIPNFMFNLIGGILMTLPVTSSNDLAKEQVGGYIMHSLATCTFLIYLCNMLIAWAVKILKRNVEIIGQEAVKTRVASLAVFRWCVICFVIIIVGVSLTLFVREYTGMQALRPSDGAVINNLNRPRYFVHATVFLPYMLFALGFGLFGFRFVLSGPGEDELGVVSPTSVNQARIRAHRAQNILAVVAMLCFLSRGILSLVIVAANNGELLRIVENGLLISLLLNALPAVCILITLHYDAILRVELYVHLNRQHLMAASSSGLYGSLADTDKHMEESGFSMPMLRSPTSAMSEEEWTSP